MSIELTRRALVQGATDISGLPEDSRKRALELSAYFTIPELEGPHKSLPLSAAMNFANKNKQLNTALNFANALLDRTGNAKLKEQAKRIKTVAERNPTDTIEIDFDQFDLNVPPELSAQLGRLGFAMYLLSNEGPVS